jgi:hypothetical protein
MVRRFVMLGSVGLVCFDELSSTGNKFSMQEEIAGR